MPEEKGSGLPKKFFRCVKKGDLVQMAINKSHRVLPQMALKDFWNK